MTGARILGNALVKLRGGKRMAGVDPLVQVLAIQSMMERFWFHWRVAVPGQAIGVACSIAQLIWASAHVD